MGAAVYCTLDLGNSRLKLRRRASLSSECELHELPNDGELVRALERELEGSEIHAAAFSSVASVALTSRILALLEARTPHVVTSTDALLRNESTTPETVGADRLFASLGALSLLPRDENCAIVCDAGTALTVDLVLRSTESEPRLGRFRGGAIAPGPELLAKSVSRGARLFQPDLESVDGETLRALGRDTTEALTSGVVHGFRGATRELVTQIARESERSSPRIFLTGGASELLRGIFDESRSQFEPALVDRGLVLALTHHLEACSRSEN